MLSRQAPRPHLGFSAVELLVATTLGLWILVLVTHASIEIIQRQRQWLRQARMQQDLRHMTELFQRELRRSGRHQAAEQTLWPAGSLSGQSNPWAALWLSADTRTLLYSHESTDGRRHHGWRQNPRTATVDLRLQGHTLQASGEDQWQALQDTRLWEAADTSFSVDMDQASLLDACPSTTCTSADEQCPPRWTRPHVQASGQGTGVAPGAPTLNWSAAVRVRNVALQGRCPGGP